ncbi:autotransporter outer membrane beta-barrel domain-containing protein [Pseudomonas sp. MAG733B]|uniref:autotransporter outer membrane beta-barrel domain-containing protein n=1 Tax=Pseudomonas sp. MAG733B TaxID=3122079 RepID=UPI0030D51435
MPEFPVSHTRNNVWNPPLAADSAHSYPRRLQLSVIVVIALSSADPALAVDCPAGPVSVNASACTVVPATTITVTSAATPGLSATGAGGNIVADGINVNLGPGALPRNFIGAQALGGGTISFNGSTITTAQIGTGQRGLVADGAGSLISATGATITLGLGATAASDLLGVVAQNRGAVLLTNSAVTTLGGANGVANHGLQAIGVGSRITFNGGSVSALGRGSFAALADSGAVVTLQGGAQLGTTGAQIVAGSLGSHAVVARGSGSQVNGTGVTLTATGTFANGARAEDGGAVTLSGSSVNTSGVGNKLITNVQNAAAMAISGGSIQLNGNSTVVTSGQYNHGVMAQGAGSSATVTDTTITTNGNGAVGVRVADATATVTNTSIFTNGSGAIGTWAEGPGSTLNITNSHITTQSNVAPAVRASLGSIAAITGGTITTNGLDSAGLSAGGGANLTATDVTTLTTGNDNAMGVIADVDGLITLNRGTVTTTGSLVRAGARPHALAARGSGATLVANGTVARTQGNDGMGVVADDGGSVRLNVDTASGAGVSVRTEGLRSIGLFSVVEQVGPQFLADITTTGATVETLGANAHGALAQQNFLAAPATINLNTTSVTTRGADAVGLRAVSAGSVVANNSVVLTQGVASHGVMARDAQGGLRSSMTVNQTSVTTSGAVAHGAVAQAGGLVTGNNSTITASGADASALYAMGAAGFVSNANFSNSALSNASGATVAIGGVADVSLTNTTVSGSGQWLRVATADSFAPLPQPAAPITGVPDVPEFDEVAGPPPVALPTPGAIPTNVPGLANIVATNSTLTGSALTDTGSVSNLTLINSTWNLTGNSNLTTLVNDPSLIDFSAPVGGVFKTLTVNTYSGDGDIALNTFLEGDGSPSDKLVIDSGTATGSSHLIIRNAADASGVLGRGALTTGNGIQVIDAVNGGTTAPGAFALGGPVYAGPYEYTLHRSSTDNSNEQAWYLRSNVAPDGPSPGPDPEPAVPNFRPQTSLYGAVPALALVYSRSIIDTLHERVGEERRLTGAPLPAEDQQEYGPSLGWGRLIYRSGERESDNGPFGNSPGYNYDLNAFQVGVDLYRSEETDGNTEQAGVSLAIGNIKGGIDHYNGANAGEDVLRAYSLGGYWTHFDPEGWYLDTVLQLNRFDIEAKPGNIGKLKTDGWGYTASLEGGYPFEVRKDLYIEPQAQIIYSYVELDDSDDLAADVRFEDVDSLIGRLGVRIDKDWFREDDDGKTRRTNGWIRPSIWHEFKGEPKTEFSSANGFVPFEADIGGTWGEINLGVDYQANERTTFYVSAGYQRAFDGESHSYEGMLGVKVAF